MTERSPATLWAKPLPSQAMLLRYLDYNPDTGTLGWKRLAPEQFDHFDNQADREFACAAHNRKYAGRQAFTTTARNGHKTGRFLGPHYLAHRVIWKMVYGEDPQIIDHINGNGGDNRIANLRSGSVADNSRNYKKPPGASSPFRGVCWVKRDGRWAARISAGHLGKVSIGYFASEVDAARAYDAAARKYHGEFAVVNFPLPAAPGEG